MFIATASTIAKMWKQLQCQTMNGETKCGTHTQWNINVLKRERILTHATTWMNLEDILPSEISQSQKDKCFRIPSIQGI